MPLHYRRILFSDDCDPWYGCPPPPSPPFFTPSPSPSPSSSPPITSPPPWTSSPFFLNPFADLAPSPSPVHDGGGGRRDQGGAYDYGPVGGAADDHRRRFITYVLSAAAALAFLSLILLGVSIAVRRRQLRRRRQALLAPAPAAATNVGNDDPEAGGGGVVHHVWYIRTVGLDEAAIDSIAVTPYRAGAGLLGAADCSVCLGEFNDGELVRLLPKCGHAFHVPCIDTWLRAHVNCPLCRSDVLDPAATAAGAAIESNSNPPADPDVNANAVAEQVAAASDSTLEHEDEEEDQEAPRVEDEQLLSSPEPEPLPQLPCPLLWNVRRAASMNAAMVSTAADVAGLDRLPDAAPEEEVQNGREKHQSGATGHPSTGRPASGGLPRSFFARHCRARSSVLPL